MKHLNGEQVPFSGIEKELATGSIGKLFRKFAIPSVIGLLFVGLQTVIDGIVLGNYVGANALASVSLILPCYNFMASVAIVVGIGCQTLVSIRSGQQDRQGANDALTSSFVFIVGFSMFFSMLFFLFAPRIATLMGANEVLLEGAVEYIRYLIPFLPVMAVMFLGDYMLKATGRPVYSMIIMSTTVVLNIVLDILLVGKWGMGIGGAGLATGIAFSVGTACTIAFMWGKKNKVSILKGRFRWRLVGNALYNGSSEGVSELSAGICAFLFNITMMRYLGEQGVAAFTALQYLLFIGVTVFLGVSDGVIPIISFNYGASLWERIRRVLMLAVRTNFVIGLFLFLLVTFFGEHLIVLFFNEDALEVLSIAKRGMGIYAFAFLLNGFNILTASYFTALGDARTSILVSLSRSLVLVAVNIVLFPRIWGIEGIWLVIPVAELCTAFISFVLVRRSLKRLFRLQPVACK